MPAGLKEPTSRVSSLACPTCVSSTRALYIVDVLEMILDELGNDRRSMSHLASTCKAIAEPTLDRLWTFNESLEPFMPLLPKELTLDDNSVFQFDPFVVSDLPLEKWATFDNYARRTRRLYVKTVTMNPHRIYSSIYKQLTDIRPNVDLFPNLITLAFHARSAPNPHLRMFSSSLRSVTFSWANAPDIAAVLWSSVMNRLLLDAPLIEHIHFEGSPKEPLHNLIPLPFQQLRKVTIKPSPLGPNVLHKYSHALSASSIRELDLRFVRWPDSRLQPTSPVFPSLKKLTFDGSPSHAIEFVRLLSSPTLQELTMAYSSKRTEDSLNLYTTLLILLADKYRGVLRTLKIQHPLQCHNQTDLESFLHAVRALADAGVGTLCLNLVVGWQDLTREVQDMVDPSKWTALRQFRISTGRASWTAGNALLGRTEAKSGATAL